MDYKKRIIKHFSTLQKYISQASTTDSFPTQKQLGKIHKDIYKGKKLIRDMPVYHSRSHSTRLVVLDALFRLKIGESIYMVGRPDTITNWCERNGLKVKMTTLNVQVAQPSKYSPTKLLMVTLVSREEHEYELSAHNGDSKGDEG